MITTLLRVLGVLAALWLAGCSTVRPWVNEPLAGPLAAVDNFSEGERDPSIMMAVMLSGGGARAAAFSYGVLAELQRSRFAWAGRETSLLEKVDLVGGVSGGSIVAAYLAVFGSDGLNKFEQDYLRQDFQDSLISHALRPRNLVSLAIVGGTVGYLVPRSYVRLTAASPWPPRFADHGD
jgi:NTE family protein